MLTELERELKGENRKQMTDLINKWSLEKDKFSGFLREDGDMEAEFLKLFKKYKLF
jgi:hypothetical protein